jgi:hypothetical protein
VLLKMLIKIIRSVMLFNLTFNNVTKKLPPGFSLFFLWFCLLHILQLGLFALSVILNHSLLSCL